MVQKGFLILLALLFSCAWASAETPRDVLVTALSGNVEHQKQGGGDWLPLAPDALLTQTDVVRTGDNSTCTLLFKGMKQATVEVRPNSMLELITVNTADSGDSTELDLSIGAVLVKAEKLQSGSSSFEVRTPNSIVGIRGTEFEVKVD